MHIAISICFVILYNKMSVKQINGIVLKDGFNHLFTEKERADLTLKKCIYFVFIKTQKFTTNSLQSHREYDELTWYLYSVKSL